MALKSFDQLSTEIDQAVHTNGALGKTTATSLNTVLKSLATELVDQQAATPDLSHKADLDSGGRVPSSQLPSYVDDIVEAASFAALPTPGEAGKIYVVLDTNQQYRWAGSAYARLSDSGLTTDVKAALEAATSLSASNPFATLADIPKTSNTVKTEPVIGDNLLDLTDPDIISDYYINENYSGNPTNVAGWKSSGFISVSPGKTYAANDGLTHSAWFDASKQFIASYGATNGVAPANAAYLRVSIQTSAFSAFMVVLGASNNVPATYQKFWKLLVNSTPVTNDFVNGSTNGNVVFGSKTVGNPASISGDGSKNVVVGGDDHHINGGDLNAIVGGTRNVIEGGFSNQIFASDSCTIPVDCNAVRLFGCVDFTPTAGAQNKIYIANQLYVPSAAATVTTIKTTSTFPITQAGQQTLTLLESAAGIVYLSVTETSGNVRLISDEDYILIDNTLTISADANLLPGDFVRGKYFLTGTVATVTPGGGSASTGVFPVLQVVKGSSQQVAGGAFTQLQYDYQEIDTDGTWNGYEFTVPVGGAGIYECSTQIRLADNFQQGVSFGLGIDKAMGDNARFSWFATPTSTTAPYLRQGASAGPILYKLAEGEKLRGFTYADVDLNITFTRLVIKRIK